MILIIVFSFNSGKITNFHANRLITVTIMESNAGRFLAGNSIQIPVMIK